MCSWRAAVYVHIVNWVLKNFNKKSEELINSFSKAKIWLQTFFTKELKKRLVISGGILIPSWRSWVRFSPPKFQARIGSIRPRFHKWRLLQTCDSYLVDDANATANELKHKSEEMDDRINQLHPLLPPVSLCACQVRASHLWQFSEESKYFALLGHVCQSD